MKRKQFVRLFFASFLLFFMNLSNLHAVMFRMLDGKTLGRAASSNGSMAFKAKVLKVNPSQDTLSVTFQIEDAIKGNIKTGDVITLHFPDFRFNGNMRLSMGIAPPHFSTDSVGTSTVLFTTTRMLDGKTLLIGGEQGQYYISNEGGKPTLYNSLGNANFLSAQEVATPFGQKMVQGMRERNSGTIPYEDFKKLINQ